MNNIDKHNIDKNIDKTIDKIIDKTIDKKRNKNAVRYTKSGLIYNTNYAHHLA